MANVCTQALYIVASNDEDMRDLMLGMLSTFKTATQTDGATDIDASCSCEQIANAIRDVLPGYNPLCLLVTDPDNDAQDSGEFNFGLSEGIPFLNITAYLKWGPSFDVKDYCSSFDPSKFGAASINGGEYMCAQGDEIAFIQAGPNMEDPFSGGVEFDKFCEMRTKAQADTSDELSALALRLLFNDVDASEYFWSAYDLDCDSLDDNDVTEPVDDCPLISLASLWCPQAKANFAIIDKLIFEVLQEFPIYRSSRDIKFAIQKERGESLFAGDQLVLKSDWSVWGTTVAKYGLLRNIEFGIYDAAGNRIGAMFGFGAPAACCENKFRVSSTESVFYIDYVLACVLSHTVATVTHVLPASLRNANAKFPEISIRLDLEPVDIGDVVAEAHELMTRDLSERSLSSKLPKGRE